MGRLYMFWNNFQDFFNSEKVSENQSMQDAFYLFLDTLERDSIIKYRDAHIAILDTFNDYLVKNR